VLLTLLLIGILSIGIKKFSNANYLHIFKYRLTTKDTIEW
jgi:hypothetical protein